MSQLRERKEPTLDMSGGVAKSETHDNPIVRGQNARVTPSSHDGVPSRSTTDSVAARPLVASAIALPVVAVFALVVAGFGYWQFQQNQQLQATLASQQSVLNRLDQQVTAVDQNLDQQDEIRVKTGLSLDERLDEVDSEIRKLWDIAHKRNRKAIADNKNQISERAKDSQRLQARFTELSAASAAMNERVEALQNAFSTVSQSTQGYAASIDDVEARMSAVDELVETLQTQLSALNQDSERLRALVRGEQQRLTQLGTQVQAQSRQSADDPVTQAIELHDVKLQAIDVHRRQINQRLQRLDSEIQALYRQLGLQS